MPLQDWRSLDLQSFFGRVEHGAATSQQVAALRQMVLAVSDHGIPTGEFVRVAEAENWIRTD